MPAYTELKAEADQRWESLVSGDKPWIRVGTAMCGQAAGALQVLEALKAELTDRAVDATVDEVGCLGLCYAEPLMDVLMPMMNGIEVLQRLRNDPATQMLPVILLTAFSLADGETNILETPNTYHVTKPWRRGVVESAIDSALTRSLGSS